MLARLRKIPDPRNPKKTKHKLTHLFVYGMLMFVYQYGSRREADRGMTTPMFMKNLQNLFPELDTLPHSDTLYRLLKEIDVESIQEAHIGLIKKLMKGKKFRRWLINNSYPISIDGTQKLSTDILWNENLLQRKKKKSKEEQEKEKNGEQEPEYQYYVYVLEANLAFHNGMVIPLLSEFLTYDQGEIETENKKQDCENKAFKRLAAQLKKHFPKLPIMLLLDGLYPNGPIIQCGLDNNWQFMIVLSDESLPSVWAEYESLLPLQTNNSHKQSWGVRYQKFTWINNITYAYGSNDRDKITLHMVVCGEQWEEVNEKGEVESKSSRHVWLSSRPLSQSNVHERCNLGARHRWGIESGFLVEKHQGYSYEHCFAQDWDAMKGYHYLMRIAHTFNILSRFSQALKDVFKTHGVRGFTAFVRSTLQGPWLDRPRVQELLQRPFQLKLQ